MYVANTCSCTLRMLMPAACQDHQQNVWCCTYAIKTGSASVVKNYRGYCRGYSDVDILQPAGKAHCRHYSAYVATNKSLTRSLICTLGSQLPRGNSEMQV